MQFDPVVYLVTGILLISLALLLRCLCRGGKTAPATAKSPRAKREPKPFAGLTHKPECKLCEQGTVSHPPAPGAPPPRMSFTRGRRRQVNTIGHFCPHTTCSYHGRDDWGNICANGIPTVAAGDSWFVSAVTSIFWKLMARRFMPSRLIRTSCCGPLRLCLKGLVSAPWSVSSKSMPTPS